MKMRMGFVSNSSSSSFIVNVQDIYGKKIKTREHLNKLIDEIKVTAENNEWSFNVYRGYLLFSTRMDNFDMREYLDEIIGCPIYPSLDIPQHSGFIEYHDDFSWLPGGEKPEYSCSIQNLRFIVEKCFHEMNMNPFNFETLEYEE